MIKRSLDLTLAAIAVLLAAAFVVSLVLDHIEAWTYDPNSFPY